MRKQRAITPLLACAELGGYGGLTGKFEITVKMRHEGEVNR